MSVAFCAWYISLLCFQLPWPSLVLFMVQWLLFVQIWECSYFFVWISVVKSPQNPFCCVLPSVLQGVPEACGSGCPLHEVRTIWENSWYFIDILACLNEPISGEFISPNAQLLWNDGVFHPPRLNKWNSVCSKNTLHHGMKHRSQPHSASQWGELGAFWKGPLVRVSLYRGGMGVLLYFPICTKNSVSCFTQK